MKPTVIVDTGPLVALFNRKDENHEWAIAGLQRLHGPLKSNPAVLTETLFLLARLGRSLHAFLEFWESGLLHVDFPVDAQRGAILRLMRKYADTPMSFADACLVRMTELDESAVVWTLDRDFRHYRRLGRQAIRRMPFPWD